MRTQNHRLLKDKKLMYFVYFAGIIITALQTGCYVYVPNVVNTPLLSNKGEVQANLNIGESGFDPQIAVAVTNNAGLMLNGSFRFNDNNSTTGEIHNFIEAGAGYYTKFEEIGRFELYGGAGIGNLRARNNDFWTYIGPEIEVNTLRLFIQPNVGVKTDYFEAALAPRLVLLNLDIGKETKTNILIEPTITAKGGFKNVKLVFQWGISVPFGNHIDNFYDPFIVSIGIQGAFGRKRAQKKQ
jgi:hypothetical protein